MTETADERLRLARQQAGYRSAAAAAEANGWKVPTYRSHENGARGYDADDATRYGQAFRVSRAWLMTGENPPQFLNQPRALSAVPMRNMQIVSLSSLRSNARPAPTDGSAIALPIDKRMSDRVEAFANPDDSMRAKPGSAESVAAGDLLMLDYGAEITPGDLCVVDINDLPSVLVRKYRPRGRDTTGALIVDFVPLNDDFPVETCDSRRPYRLVGRIIGQLRRF
jgi:SOS-response transcriptional repressor LexA